MSTPRHVAPARQLEDTLSDDAGRDPVFGDALAATRASDADGCGPDAARALRACLQAHRRGHRARAPGVRERPLSADAERAFAHSWRATGLRGVPAALRLLHLRDSETR